MKITFSLVFAFLFGIMNAVNLVFDGWFFQHFALFTERFFVDMEFWRLISYPFFSNSSDGVLISLATFVFISPKLERFFGTKIYPIFLFLIAFVVGSVNTIIYSGEKIAFGGLEGVTFFILALHIATIWNDKSINKVRYIPLILIPIMIWGGLKFINENTMVILPSLTMAGTGTALGILVYSQVYFIIKRRLRKSKEKIKAMQTIKKTISNEKRGYTIYNSPKFNEIFNNPKIFQSFASIKEKTYKENFEPIISDEERLDEILDKMNERGKDSLSKEECEFLHHYSAFLNK